LLEVKRECSTRSTNIPKCPGVLPADIKIRHPFTRGRHVPPNDTPGLLLYLMKGSFPRYSSLYFLVPVMCQGNQRPKKRILLIRLEETPPQTGLNEAAIPEMLIATPFFFNLRMLPRRWVRQVSEMTGVATDRSRIPISDVLAAR
jgi:hypothetical protein